MKKPQTLRSAILYMAFFVLPFQDSIGQNAKVDYAFSPPFWQSTVCLPDDPFKTLVDEQGNLVIHTLPVSNYGEARTRIGIDVSSRSEWYGQRMLSARIPVIITEKKQSGFEISEEAFAVTGFPSQVLSGAVPLADEPEMERGAGKEKPANTVVLVRIRNTGKQSQILAPVIRISSTLPVAFSGQLIRLNNRENLGVTLPLDQSSLKITDRDARIQMMPLTIGAEQTISFAVILYSGGAFAPWPATLEEAEQSRLDAESFWKSTRLPYNRILVPDSQVQDLIDASIRNIWQSREIKNGLPAFQVGPTCYRGLWIVDGAFLLEAATILGTGSEARNGVMYNLSFQKEDGRFEVMEKYWKENGIIAWTAIRHALLTQDKQWLESVWPKLTRAMEYVVRLREESRKDDTPLNDGLMPAGNIDGGLSFGQEYTNVYWNLMGMKAFIQAAHWLGKNTEADRWQKEYDDFYSCFRNSARRDMLSDPFGNNYLPVLMGGEGSKPLPQKAQWAFCQAVYPGQLFDREDPLAIGNMAMLEKTEREGMVYGTGWDAKGFWNYFASFYGHAWLWQGNGQKAAQSLYAFANHASPVLAWREEQSPKGEPYKKVGDMPHNWASAEFIRLAVHLLALDRGQELHLLEGLPAEWTGPGMTTRLNGVATPFGPLTMKLEVSKNGKSAMLTIDPLSDPSCTGIMVHTTSLNGSKANIRMDPRKPGRIRISIPDRLTTKDNSQLIWKKSHPGTYGTRVGTPPAFNLLTVAKSKPREEAIKILGDAPVPVDLKEIRGTVVNGRTCLRFPLEKGEQVYGFGLNFKTVAQRGRIFRLHVDHYGGEDNGRTHAPVPFFISSKGYGVLVNAARYIDVSVGSAVRKDSKNPPVARDRNTDSSWDAQPYSDNIEMLIPESGVEIILFTGKNLMEVVQRFNLYCGGGIIPPKWGLGFWQRTPTLYDENDVRNEALGFEQNNFPLDVVGLEPGWHSKSYPCTFEWDQTRFPRPAGFISEMTAKGIHLNLWMNPYHSPGGNLDRQLEKYTGSHTVWCGTVADYTLPAARRIMQDHFEKNQLAIGASGFKIDEVDGFDSWLWPDGATFPSGHDGEQMRQTYGLQLMTLTDEIYRKKNERTYGLIRAANAGSVSYPYVIYNDYYSHTDFITALINAGFSGLLWTPEVRASGSSEEWVRRMQTVCFSPMAMINAWADGTKPWSFPEVYKACQEVAFLRMQLLPYLYSAFAQYHFEGKPPFRAMQLAEGFPAGGEIRDQYMVGDNLLVAPFFTGETERKVIFPPGLWFDFYSGKLAGEGTATIKAESDKIPLFVRDGGIIPMIPAIRQTELWTAKLPVEVRIYGTAGGSFDLYNDDGKTFNFEKGEYSIQHLEMKDGKGTSVQKKSATFEYPVIQWKALR